MTDDQIKLHKIAESCRHLIERDKLIITEFHRMKKDEYADRIRNKQITIARLKALAVARVIGWQHCEHKGWYGFTPKDSLHPYKRQSELTSMYPTKQGTKKLEGMLAYALQKISENSYETHTN